MPMLVTPEDFQQAARALAVVQPRNNCLACPVSVVQDVVRLLPKLEAVKFIRSLTLPGSEVKWLVHSLGEALALYSIIMEGK